MKARIIKNFAPEMMPSVIIEWEKSNKEIGRVTLGVDNGKCSQPYPYQKLTFEPIGKYTASDIIMALTIADRKLAEIYALVTGVFEFEHGPILRPGGSNA